MPDLKYLWCALYIYWHIAYLNKLLIFRRKPPSCCKSLTNFVTSSYIEYTSPWCLLDLTTLALVVLDTDCTSNSNLPWDTSSCWNIKIKIYLYFIHYKLYRGVNKQCVLSMLSSIRQNTKQNVNINLPTARRTW